MEKKSILLVVFCLIFTAFAFGQKTPPKDKFDRKILTENGAKINYTEVETPKEKEVVNNNVFNNKPLLAPIKIDTFFENNANLYTVMGDGIGAGGLKATDIDNDGKLEIFCTANTSNGSYWYIMQFNRGTNVCEMLWSSPVLKGRITSLEILDIGNDKKYKVYIAFDNGGIFIYDAKTKNLEKTDKITNAFYDPFSLFYADADNDTVKDLIVGSKDNIYILDVKTLEQKFKIKDNGLEVKVGNVDGDTKNEIVTLSGKVYELNQFILKEEWVFGTNTNGYGLLELANLDSDNALEIVFCPGWYSIYVYDADTETTKYTIKTDLDVNSMILTDTNGDGTTELLYGDGQWGEIHCINTTTQTENWMVKNPEHGVTGIIFSDLDNDSKKELVWGAGASSSGADYLYIYDVDQEKQLWRSEDVRGPFYAIASGDVDGDNKPEIVAVSYESESGYKGGVLFIIDAETNKIKWQSPTTFLENNIEGVFCLQIKDIDKDGLNDIVIAADDFYDGKIWIINGKTYSLKSSHEFNQEDVDAFRAMFIEDIDGDGKEDIVASAGNQVYVINPITFVIKWKVQVGANTNNSTLKFADINGDGKKEIIYCNGTIQVINPQDKSLWTTTTELFSSFDLLDYNNDKQIDIVGVYNGTIKILDGATRKVYKTINVLDFAQINGIKILPYNNTNIILLASNGRIYYYTDESNVAVGQFFGESIGFGSSLQSIAISSGSDILLGTPISVLRIFGKNLDCISLNINAKIDEISCNSPQGQDGKIALNITGGLPPYEFKWNNNSTLDSLTSLKEGTYNVIVKDKNGCEKDKSFEIVKGYIDANIKTKNAGCGNSLGSANLNIVHGLAPFNIQWSNTNSNNTLENKNLLLGSYMVTVSDVRNCKAEIPFSIDKDSLIIEADVTNVSCFGYNNASIYLYKIAGIEPINFTWKDGWTNPYRSQLKAGQYSVTATDLQSCKTVLDFNITQPEKINYKINTSPDNSNTSTWEGKIIINSFSGGSPPYNVYWPELGKYGSFLDGLPAGTYEFYITDKNNCSVAGSVILEGITASKTLKEEENSIDLFPNPAISNLYFQLNVPEGETCNYAILDLNGKILHNNTMLNSFKSFVDVTNFLNGIYLLRIESNQRIIYKKFVVQH